MHTPPPDYVIELPCTTRPVKPVVYNRRMGFEVRALREISFHAAREMHWVAGISLPAHGYLFIETESDETGDGHRNVIVGAAFFSRDMDEDVHAEWFLTSVWLHQTARGKGFFARSLPAMEEAFGQFAICGPYSEGFRNLMKRDPRVASHAIEKFLISAG